MFMHKLESKHVLQFELISKMTDFSMLQPAMTRVNILEMMHRQC